MLAGAGHGWNTPALVSIVFWEAYPLTLYVGQDGVPYRKVILLNLLICAIGGSAWLIIGTISAASYLAASLRVNGIPGFVIASAWSALWVFWQVILVRKLMAAAAARSDA